MRGVLDVCSRVGRVGYRGVMVTVHKRVRLIAVMLVLSLLMAALPASSGSARAARKLHARFQKSPCRCSSIAVCARRSPRSECGWRRACAQDSSSTTDGEYL